MTWRVVSFVGALGRIDNLSVRAQNAACATDHNNSGSVEMTDIFDFLYAWFAGC